VAFSPDAKRIVSATLDNTLTIWDVDTGNELLTLTGHFDRIHDIAFSPDGRQIATASEDQTVKLWNGTPAELQAPPQGGNAP
jgi:WD40 repeat protein